MSSSRPRTSWSSLFPSFGCLVVACVTARSASADLIAHWRFDERRGTTAHDSVGTVDGTLLGDASFVPGVAGNAVLVSTAGNGLVDFGDVFAFTGNTSFSISLWMRSSTMSTAVNEIPLARHVATNASGYIIFANVSGGCYGDPGLVSFYQGTGCGGEITATTPVTDLSWHHVVVVHEGAGASRIYIDGAPAEATGPSVAISHAPATLLVGGVYGGTTPTNLYNGAVDELQIFRSVLTPCQVQYLFEHPGANPPLETEDLNGDGSVNAADLALLLGAWGPCPGCGPDLDCDGQVSASDLARVLGAWTG